MNGCTVVVGAGISGLVAARELARSGAENVVLVEGSDRLGGKINRVTLPGPADPASIGPSTSSGQRPSGGFGGSVVLDSGAESVLIRRPEALELINELGLDDRLTYPTGAKASALVDGRARPLPPTAMGIPTDLDALAGYLTPAGLRRARQEPDLPAPPVASDVGIGAYVDQRFGPEVTDRLVEPMLGGVYAGQSRQLSFEAVHPALFDAIRSGGSLLGHAREVAGRSRRDDRQSPPPAVAGLIGGVGELIQALTDDLRRRGVTIRTNTTLRSVRRLPDGRFELTGGPVPRPETLTACRVVLATPAPATARLTGTLAPAAAVELSAVAYASTALVVAVLADADVAGSGLLVPRGELETIKAFTHSANKWDWVADQCARLFGENATVVRISIGRHHDEPQLQFPDRHLIDRTIAEARQVPGLDGARVLQAVVQRWGGALPQYAIGHQGRVARLRAAIGAIDGLEIAGAYLDGVGVPACVAAARQAVANLLD